MAERLRCPVRISQQLTPTVWEVVVSLPQPVAFNAGQYLQVVMDERDKRPFSIASCPSAKNEWLLHIGATPDNRYALDVLEKIERDGELEIEAPLGEAFYQPSNREAIVIAGGTGFSYAYAIVQNHLREHHDKPLTLYWGARSPQDLYLHNELEQLAQQHSNFVYRPVVEEADSSWNYDVGLVHHAVMTRHQDLANYEIYVAGRFEMVRVIRDDFVARDVPLAQIHGDALAFI